MCIGYEPFKWADNYGSEEEYFKELIKENEENDKTRSSSSGNTSNADIERQ